MRRHASLFRLALVVFLTPGLCSPALAQSTEELIANLRSPVAKARREAAHELGERRQKEASEALQGAMRSETDPEVRSAVVIALGRIKDMAALPVMLAALQDGEVDVRRNAILALVMLYIEKDIDFILARRAGINLLNPFLSTYDNTVVDPDSTVDPRIPEALIKLVGRDPEDVGIPAIRALGVLHATSVVEALGQKMAATSGVRVEILRAFIKIGDPAAGKYLTRFLNDDDSKVRHQALTAAGVLRAKNTVPELLKIYRSDADEKTRKLAFEALGQIGDPATERVMIEALLSPSAEMRRFANEGLGRIMAVKETEQISGNRLKEKDASVKLAQAFVLYQLGRREYLQAITAELDSPRKEQASEYLLEIKPEDLYPFVNQGTNSQRKRVIEALGKTGSSGAISHLKPALRADDASLANAANLAIFRIQKRMSIPLKPAAEESDRQSRPKRVKP